MKIITETSPNGTLRYDGTCRFCIGMVTRTLPILRAAKVGARPFENGARQEEMILEWKDGTTRSGAGAVFFLARRIWWAVPFGLLEWFPGVRFVADRFYRYVAARRNCINGACEIDFGKETN